MEKGNRSVPRTVKSELFLFIPFGLLILCEESFIRLNVSVKARKRRKLVLPSYLLFSMHF